MFTLLSWHVHVHTFTQLNKFEMNKNKKVLRGLFLKIRLFLVVLIHLLHTSAPYIKEVSPISFVSSYIMNRVADLKKIEDENTLILCLFLFNKMI